MPSAISPAIWIIFLSGGKTWLVEFCEERKAGVSAGSVCPTDLELKPFVLIPIKEAIFFRNSFRFACVKAAYFFAQRAQVALEISAGHQLHDHQGRLSLRHHAQQPHLHRSQHSSANQQLINSCR